jgi:glycosyltransferase involved in cell wall biosynthesis
VIRVDLLDPPAFTPPYDHALASALARHGASVRLITSRFGYGEVADPDGYRRLAVFYGHTAGRPGSRLHRVSKLAGHLPGMLRLRRLARQSDLMHLQWAALPWLDAHLLADLPLVITAHDLLPREPGPGQVAAQRRLLRRADAVVVHSEYGRRTLLGEVGLEPSRVHVIRHGAFEHLTRLPDLPLAPELRDPPPSGPVVLSFGLLRPYKGIEVLLEAWRGIEGGELWIVGRPLGLDPAALHASAPPRVRILPRFVAEGEVAALFRRADLVVLPYRGVQRLDFSGVLATALAFGAPLLLTDVGGFAEVAAAGAARIVAPDDPVALRAALQELIGDPAARERLAQGARSAAAGPWSWDQAALETLRLYATILRA